MPSRKMVKWFSGDWGPTPHEDKRLNPFILDLSGPEVELMPARDAGIKAVEAIVDQYPGPYTLLASGGVDSQAMIWFWHITKVPFKVVHYSYLGALNAEDTRTLVEFCTAIGVPFEVRIFDAFGFIESQELIDYAKEFDCASPHISTYIKLTQQHPNETVIMSGNFVSVDKCGINYTIYGLERYSQQEKPNFVPFFLMSTPELAYAFYRYELDQRILQDSEDIYVPKLHTYRNATVPIVPQSDKLTGFEQMKEIADAFPVPSRLRLKYSQMVSRRPFDLLYRYALFDHIPKYTEETRITHNHCIKE